MLKIKALRKKSGLTQAGLAERLGVGQTTVAEWESGRTMPKTSMLPLLAGLFGCPIDNLFV